jgi:hypothetical protein
MEENDHMQKEIKKPIYRWKQIKKIKLMQS